MASVGSGVSEVPEHMTPHVAHVTCVYVCDVTYDLDHYLHPVMPCCTVLEKNLCRSTTFISIWHLDQGTGRGGR
jgi:hypothetical protein